MASDNSVSSMSSIYLAGGFHQLQAIDYIKDQITTQGYKVNSNWTKREVIDQTPENKEYFADCDVNELLQSDYIIAIMTDPKYAYRGTFTEIGLGIGSNKNIIIVCDGNVRREKGEIIYSHYCMTNVFYWHKSIIHVSNITEALEFIVDNKSIKTDDNESEDYNFKKEFVDNPIHKSESFESISSIHSTCMR